MRFLFFITFILTAFGAKAQCPTAEFSTADDTVCRDGNVLLTNLTVNAEKYQWDLCAGELRNDPDLQTVLDLNVGYVSDLEFVKDGENWYGFAVQFWGKTISRLSFGNSLINIPVVETISGLDGILTNPTSISFIQDSSGWVGLITNYNPGKMFRIEFGDDLNSTPVVNEISVTGPGILIRPSDIKVIQSNGLHYALVANELSGPSLLSFGPNIRLSANSKRIGDIPSYGCEMVEDCGHWYGYLSGSNLQQLDFELGLDSPPVIQDLILNTPITNSRSLIYTYDAGKNYLHVGVADGKVLQIELGQQLDDLNSKVKDFGNFGLLNNELRGLSGAYDKGEHTFFLRQIYGNNALYRLNFAENCNEPFYSEDATPTINYESVGMKYITLRAITQNGVTDYYSDSIFVKDESAPTTSFTSSNVCITNQNTFSASSSDDPSITSWNWDFGDGIGSASGQNVNYQFLDTGSYNVKLSIDAVNGCSNTSSQYVNIYNPPLAGFSYTSGITCSNSLLDFSNNTIFYGPDSILTYLWNMDNETTLSVTNPSFTFTTGGDKNITLTASIPGCSSEISNVINITPGPMTNFSFDGTCAYDVFSFTNTTTGDGITGYHWDFGDGYFSSNASPNHLYESGGNYIASLTASNALGCNTVLEQVVSVRHIPELFFTNDLACSNNSVSLTDQSTVTDANITQRYWAMEKSDIGYVQSETGSSPYFDLEDPGIYLATLIAESNYGCLDTLSRQIEVLQSPVADFSFNNTCFGDSVSFLQHTELPGGTNLLNTDWLIDGQLYSEEQATYKFQSPGDYNVELYVRSDNYCTDNISKLITIHPLPAIDFSLSSTCEDQLITITPTVASPNDLVIAYNWSINNKPVSSQEFFSYEFKKANDYSVALNVITENNCTNIIDKTITINPSPTSRFDAFPSHGASPLKVQFNDRSSDTQEINYLFSRYNEDSSDEPNPTYTYHEIGSDLATQIVKNQFGCSDTSSQAIEVVIPSYDISLTSVSVEVVDDQLQFLIGLHNNGTIILNNPVLEIKIAEKVSLKHTIETTIMPGERGEFLLDFNVLKPTNESLDYICFKLPEIFGNYVDLNASDNQQCVNIDQGFNVLEPFPNPSRQFINIPIVLPGSDDCDLQLIGEQGNIIYSRKFSNLSAGLNTIKMDLASYRNGIYMVVVKVADFKTTRKIVIQ